MIKTILESNDKIQILDAFSPENNEEPNIYDSNSKPLKNKNINLTITSTPFRDLGDEEAGKKINHLCFEKSNNIGELNHLISNYDVIKPFSIEQSIVNQKETPIINRKVPKSFTKSKRALKDSSIKSKSIFTSPAKYSSIFLTENQSTNKIKEYQSINNNMYTTLIENLAPELKTKNSENNYPDLDLAVDPEDKPFEKPRSTEAEEDRIINKKADLINENPYSIFDSKANLKDINVLYCRKNDIFENRLLTSKTKTYEDQYNKSPQSNEILSKSNNLTPNKSDSLLQSSTRYSNSKDKVNTCGNIDDKINEKYLLNKLQAEIDWNYQDYNKIIKKYNDVLNFLQNKIKYILYETKSHLEKSLKCYENVNGTSDNFYDQQKNRNFFSEIRQIKKESLNLLEGLNFILKDNFIQLLSYEYDKRIILYDKDHNYILDSRHDSIPDFEKQTHKKTIPKSENYNEIKDSYRQSRNRNSLSRLETIPLTNSVEKTQTFRQHLPPEEYPTIPSQRKKFHRYNNSVDLNSDTIDQSKFLESKSSNFHSSMKNMLVDKILGDSNPKLSCPSILIQNCLFSFEKDDENNAKNQKIGTKLNQEIPVDLVDHDKYLEKLVSEKKKFEEIICYHKEINKILKDYCVTILNSDETEFKIQEDKQNDLENEIDIFLKLIRKVMDDHKNLQSNFDALYELSIEYKTHIKNNENEKELLVKKKFR